MKHNFNYKEDNKMIEYKDLKNSGGFVITWFLTLFSSMAFWFAGNESSALLGILVLAMMGFLGGDMLGDLINKINNQTKLKEVKKC